MASTDSPTIGPVAERAAARKYRLEAADEQTGYYDLRAANGCRYQVKSARHTRASGNPGKFRFWRDHLEKLDEDQSAVILVLTTESDHRPHLKITKVSTTEVLETINGRWYPSGHADEGEQYKVPWPDLVEL